nr:hypothetical protein [uncultured bacterium]
MTKNIDYEIIKAATANGGAITLQTLNGAGVSATSIRRRVRAGQLFSPFKGVYIVRALQSSESMLFAASLAYPAGAVCRFSAATRLGFDVTVPSRPEIVVGQGSALKSRGIQFRETRSLPEVDVVVHDGLRTTSPARTLCDISGRVRPGRLRHMLETQLTRAAPDADDLVACVRSRRRRGVEGVGHLAEMLAFVLDDEPVAESILEMRLYEGLTSVGLTNLIRQFRPEWYDGIRGIVDFADPAGRTIIEADGRRFRQVTQAHDNDRRRDRKAAAHGYVVLRVGFQELTNRRESVLAEISDVVTSRRRALSDSVLSV